jgi:hypothetical protein
LRSPVNNHHGRGSPPSMIRYLCSDFSFLSSPFYQFHAPVFLLSVLCVVGGDGSEGGHAVGFQPRRCSSKHPGYVPAYFQFTRFRRSLVRAVFDVAPATLDGDRLFVLVDEFVAVELGDLVIRYVEIGHP